jgi:hypothetical protein
MAIGTLEIAAEFRRNKSINYSHEKNSKNQLQSGKILRHTAQA